MSCPPALGNRAADRHGSRTSVNGFIKRFHRKLLDGYADPSHSMRAVGAAP